MTDARTSVRLVQPAGSLQTARPSVLITGGERGNIARFVARILGKQGKIYARGGLLVRVVEHSEALRSGLLLQQAHNPARPGSAPVIVAAGRDWLQTVSTDEIDFQRADRNGVIRSVDCPSSIAAAVSSLGTWADLDVKPLLGLAHLPFLRTNGTICTRDGYDEDSHLLVHGAEGFPSVMESPSLTDAQEAKTFLLQPFAEFPFAVMDDEGEQVAGELHRSSFLALLLTLITRHLYPTAPAFMLTANTPGTGKTLLFDCASLIATGISWGLRAFSDDPEEMRKLLTGAALAGDPIVAFDNLVAGAKVSNSALERFLTASTISDRVLGTTNSTTLANTCVVLLNGNNISPRGDFIRRALQVHLVVNVERPQERTFGIAELRPYILLHRPKLIAAALTILRAFVVAGAPSHGLAPLGGFEVWDSIVRRTLLWLGMPDPVKTQTAAHDADDELAGARAMLTALAEFQKGFFSGFTAGDVKREVLSRPGLNASLIEAIDAAGTTLDKLPYWFRDHMNRVHGKQRLKRMPTGAHGGIQRWSVTAV